MKVEDGLDQAAQLILQYHVSLGDPYDYKSLAPPNGSGTFVKFSVRNRTIFGILTAAHIARWLKITFTNNKHQLLGISKPYLQDTLACLTPFQFIYFSADIRYFHLQSDLGYFPDVAFICLGNDIVLPTHEIFSRSKFYDLDTNVEFGYEEDRNIFSTFFRGACHDNERTTEGYLNTQVCLGGGEILKRDKETNFPYWQIPNDTGKSVGGASGAGFWRHRIERGNLRTSFEGVIVAESPKYDYIEAISPTYLYDTFLPSLKESCIDYQSE